MMYSPWDLSIGGVTYRVHIYRGIDLRQGSTPTINITDSVAF